MSTYSMSCCSPCSDLMLKANREKNCCKDNDTFGMLITQNFEKVKLFLNWTGKEADLRSPFFAPLYRRIARFKLQQLLPILFNPLILKEQRFQFKTTSHRTQEKTLWALLKYDDFFFSCNLLHVVYSFSPSERRQFQLMQCVKKNNIFSCDPHARWILVRSLLP